LVRIGAAPLVSRAAVLLGRVPGSQPIAIDVALRPRDPPALARFASAVSTPGSPDFRRYLRPGAFGSVFGATAATVRSTTAALRRLGLDVGAVSSNHLVVKVSTTVATAERAFDTTLVRYRLGSGAPLYANLSAPRVPASLAGGIQAIAGLSDLAHARPEGLVRPDRRAGARAPNPVRHSDTPAPGPQPCPAATSVASASGPYTADQIASAYGFSGLYAAGDLGAGETVAIFELEAFSKPDVEAYDSCYFGPTQAAAMAEPPRLDVFPIDGVNSGGTPVDVESTLDVEDVSGFAPQARIDVYEGPNNDTGPLDVYNAIVTQDRAEVISTSWGICEAQVGGNAVAAAEANLFEEAAAQGQTVVAASGDDGSTDCTDANNDPTGVDAVDNPASQPYVTGVGGTSLTTLGPPPAETVWNNAYGASGGGISSSWGMPAYQSKASPRLHVIKTYSSARPCGVPTGYCREVPDVSADADFYTGLVIYGADWPAPGWGPIGGTSIAAPLWAALAALTDAWPTCEAHPVGFLNPALYSIAGSSPSAYANAFNDITAGDNHLSSFPNSRRYGATVGYDLASGLGTPDAADSSGGGLVARLCRLPESGGVPYASPTKSSITAVRLRVKASRTAFSTVTVTLRTPYGLPVAAKRVILVGTATPPAATRTRIRPVQVMTNAKGGAVFKVSDQVIQKVIYRATDLTDGVLVDPFVTVSFVKP
jgi:subtilase family serine protease